jgi:hypothetical protein
MFEAMARRNSRGVAPLLRLNSRLKCEMSEAMRQLSARKLIEFQPRRDGVVAQFAAKRASGRSPPGGGASLTLLRLRC